jgi:hypothetical protein
MRDGSHRSCVLVLIYLFVDLVNRYHDRVHELCCQVNLVSIQKMLFSDTTFGQRAECIKRNMVGHSSCRPGTDHVIHSRAAQRYPSLQWSDAFMRQV